MIRSILIFAALFFLLPFDIAAQELNNSNSPVEITADNSLEWLQKEKQYVANGNVEVIQGESKIFSDKLVADYRDNQKGGNTEIWQLTATDNVRIINQDSTVQGDKAIYNIDSKISIVTGGDLKLTTPDQTITANERMEYDMNKGIAKAVGNAKIIKGEDTLTAQTITANFIKDSNGKQSLKTATASGGVSIKTPKETLTGNEGVYNAVNNTAEITGNVKIVRGPNQLEGARAEVNLNTNISKMFGEPSSGKRVKGIFFPNSKSKE